MKTGAATLLLAGLMGLATQLSATNIAPGTNIIPVPGPDTAPAGLFGATSAGFGANIVDSYPNASWTLNAPNCGKPGNPVCLNTSGTLNEAVYSNQNVNSGDLIFFVQLDNCTVANGTTFKEAAGACTGGESLASINLTSYAGTAITGVSFITPTSDQDKEGPNYLFLGSKNNSGNAIVNAAGGNSEPYEMSLSQDGGTITFDFGPNKLNTNTNPASAYPSAYVSPGTNSAILEIETNDSCSTLDICYDGAGGLTVTNSHGVLFASNNAINIAANFEPLVTPEPGLYAISGLGLAGLMAFVYRRKRNSASVQ